LTIPLSESTGILSNITEFHLSSYLLLSYHLLLTHIITYYIALKLTLSLVLFFSHHISNTDEDNLLDVSAEIIEETPVKKKPYSLRPYAEDVVRHLGLITSESGRADAANPSFSNTFLWVIRKATVISMLVVSCALATDTFCIIAIVALFYCLQKCLV